ncbi:NAD(P)/FAD-dependent oxidoreductase, partial [Umezakia ovalisporum]|uniref:NAD(P)/FAD-dependent oxidoreductase n=1 Tax=Umezakia ovalisporum TaxID=75695 RepID=UPI0039C5F777
PRINELQLSAPGGNALIHTLEPGGFGISRYKLDAMLADCAREAGVTLLTQCKVNNIAYNQDGFAIDTQHGKFFST